MMSKHIFHDEREFNHICYSNKERKFTLIKGSHATLRDRTACGETLINFLFQHKLMSVTFIFLLWF